MTRRRATTLLLALALAGCAGAPDAPDESDTAAGELRDETLPAAAEEVLTRGEQAFREGRFEEAFRAGREAVEAAPAAPQPYARLSTWFTRARRHEQAIAAFDELARNGGHALRYAARHRALSGDYEGALGTLAHCIGRYPRHAGCRVERARLAQSRGNFKDALADLRVAYETDKSDRTAAMLAEALRVHGSYDEAEAIVAEALARSPRSTQLRLAEARFRMRALQYDEAETTLRALLEVDARDAEVQRQLATLLLRTNRAEEGTFRLALADLYRDYDETYDALLAQLAASRDSFTALVLGELDLTVGRYREALRWLELARSGGAPEARVAPAMAWAWYALGDFDRGDAELGRVRDADAPHAALARAARAARVGNAEEAKRWLARAVSAGPVERSFLRRASDLYRAVGAQEESRRLLLRAKTAAFP